MTWWGQGWAGVLTFLAPVSWRLWCYMMLHYGTLSWKLRHVMMGVRGEGGRAQSGLFLRKICNSKRDCWEPTDFGTLGRNTISLGPPEMFENFQILWTKNRTCFIPDKSITHSQNSWSSRKTSTWAVGSNAGGRFRRKFFTRNYTRNSFQALYAFRPLLWLQDSCPM